MTSLFQIKTETFEGPLDLLLNLIEKRKLFINDISLSAVTDEYIRHSENLPHYSLSDKSEFILIASTLILIKSRSLLPNLTLTEEEEENIKDLERRLLIYQKIKELTLHIKEKFYKDRIHFRKEKNKIVAIFSPHEKINNENLRLSLLELIKKLPVKERNPEVTIKKVISLEEMINNLTERVKVALKMSFKEFSGKKQSHSKEEKVNVIVSFLAMLELVKQGMIDVIQDRHFDDIKMETKELSTPRYG